MKKCSRCKIDKPLTDYHKRSNRPCGVRSICKQCYKGYEFKRRPGYAREHFLMKSYSMTPEQYNSMLEKQEHKCAICKIESSSMTGKKKHLCIDHSHKTGMVRGLLCDKCNRGIGLLNDNIITIKSAIDYLNSF
jgi:hypothetical protein